MNIKLITLLLVTLPVLAIAQSTNQNYILKRTYTSSSAFFDDIQYYDGLGRPVETVQKQFTPGGKDLVSRIEYDAFGRENKQWLPAPNTKSDGTYNGSTNGATHYSDTYPYSETVYEPSPLNRVQNQYGPGAAWRSGGGHKVTIEYMTNKTTDSILNCPLYHTPGGNDFSKNGDYPTGQLYVTKTTDEDGNISYEFKDKLGRVLLQRRMSGNTRHDTNYIYDDFGNLSHILMPIASDVLTANQTYNIWGTYSNICLAGYVYLFNHDYRNRMDTKIVPGGTMEPYVYDKADRLVMTQTPAIQIPGGDGDRGWLFNKYDALGRVVLSGIYHGDDYTSNNVNLRVYLMRELYKNIVSKESTVNDPSKFYYTWSVFPAFNDSEVTKVNFYDNYNYCIDNSSNNGSLAYTGKTNYGTQWTSAQGLLTGTWDRMLDGSGWIKTVYYYDAYGNMIQKRSTSNKGYDYEYYAYNYNNQMTKKFVEHYAFGTVQPTEEYTYSYGSRLRLDSVNYKFNGETTGVTIAAYKYNNLGQIQEKKTGGGKETTAFNYNLRGWETDRTGQKFSENLYYTTNPKSGGATYYGGNISALTWKATEPTTSVRGYSFTYDALGQLSNAVYGEGTAINTNTSRYDESFTYDKHGNIKTLKRSGLKDNNTFGLIDDLTVTYIENRMRTISDVVTVNQNSSDVMEFKFNSEPVNDGHYFYWGTGALAVDYHKRICMMKYNYLTLPKSVQFRKGDRIEYVYDAAGVRRQTTHKVANRNMNYGYWSLDEPQASDFITSATVTTNYLGNRVYVNNQLKYIMTEEGYIEKAAGSNTYTANYYLNDHLGSRRVVMDATGTVKQVNNFYPSGTSIAEYPRRTDQGVQPWKFESKELDRTNGLDFYDFEARAYDPVLMRFNGADPLAEKYPHISPYVFCANNPVNRIDPTGLTDYKINENGYIYDSSSWWDKIKRLWNGPDKTDKLIAQNGNTLTMEAGTMTNFTDKKNNEGIKIGQSFQIANSDVAEQVHEFLSENTMREYGVVDDVKNGISTSTITTSLVSKSSNDAPAVAQKLLQSGADVIQMTHNHLIGFDPTPSGYKPGHLDNNDKRVVKHFNENFPNSFIIHRVYDPKNKVYIYYDANNIYKTEPKKH